MMMVMKVEKCWPMPSVWVQNRARLPWVIWKVKQVIVIGTKVIIKGQGKI